MKLSKEKRDKISEQIISFLFESSPKTPFTAEISREIARDEEFIKTLLQDLNTKGLVIPVKKNSLGQEYKRRTRWRLSNRAYSALKSM